MAAVLAVVFTEAFLIGPPRIARGDVAAIERHLVEGFRERTTGSSALVMLHGGTIVAEHGFGSANADTRAPVTTDRTLFIVASISKAVTAWGVMRLVQDGVLHLDEPVIAHLKRWRFPGSEAYRDKVTIRHLLSHTAGLEDGHGYGGFLPGETVQTLEESLNLAKDSVGRSGVVTVAREPGTRMAYSGGGYAVLQLLIEEVTQRSFADYMREAVLRPLGMTHASFDWDAIVAEGRAGDLATSFDPDGHAHPPRRYAATAAVSLYATARDIAQFARAFTRQNPVLAPDTLQRMIAPQPATSETWGLGHTLFAEDGARGHVVGHDGGTLPGWGSALRVNPATGNGVVMLVNGFRGAVSRFADDWILWETGKVRMTARRQIVYDRAVPAAVALSCGAIAIALWRHRR